MTHELRSPASDAAWPELVRQVRARTPARLLAARVGVSYDSETQLRLREDHAAARDAVRTEFDLELHLGREFVAAERILVVSTRAASKREYLLRPDLGRRFSDAATAQVAAQCPPGADLQIAIGDGLSVTAVATQVPQLLPVLQREAERRGWRMGQTFAIRYCRVGLMNQIGELLRPEVLVLLIGERPGMATAESLSAYMAFRPHAGHTDADRNLISNIHVRGTNVAAAAVRIADLAQQMMQQRTSGTAVKEIFAPDAARLPGGER
ncbi:MAG: ethanolamine ammonia-lyase subunit EutC [Acidobacteriota bacterium]|nr:ethanolamine ammonia-lyase subunit EutC [Acidobacteriota bacterium]